MSFKRFQGFTRTDSDEALDEFIREEEQHLNKARIGNKSGLEIQRPNVVKTSRTILIDKRGDNEQHSSSNADHQPTPTAQFPTQSSKSNVRVHGLKKISKKSLLILKRYIDSDPSTINERLNRLAHLSEPRKNPYDEFPIKIIKNKQTEKDRMTKEASAPWKDSNKVDYALPLAQDALLSNKQPNINTSHIPVSSNQLPRPPSGHQLRRSYNPSRSSILRKTVSDDSKGTETQRSRRSVSPTSPPKPALNIELVIESKPYKNLNLSQINSHNNIDIHESTENNKNIMTQNGTNIVNHTNKNKKSGKIIATSTFTPVSNFRTSDNMIYPQPPIGLPNEEDDVGSKPLQWSKQFGYPGRVAHRKRDQLSEKNRNKPPPASQSEHLLDIIQRMLRRLCRKLAQIIAKSYNFADDHRASILNASNIQTPRESNATIEKAIHVALIHLQGSVQFDSKNNSKQKNDPIDSADDTANEDDHSAVNMNESQTLSVSSHESSKVSKGKKSAAEDSLSSALKLLSCVPNHRPLEEMATIYLWMLFDRPRSSHNAAPTSSKLRSKSLSHFVRCILAEFSEVVSATKSCFVDYHKVCSDRGLSTLKEEPQRERILMENMRCWHTEVGKRISEAQYESLCKSVKSSLSISRSFIYSQVSVTNDSTAAIGLSFDSSLADKPAVPITPPFAQRQGGQNMELGPISKQINAALTGEDSFQPSLGNEDMKSRATSSKGLLNSENSTAGDYGGQEGCFSVAPEANDKSKSLVGDKKNSSRKAPVAPKRPVSAGSIRRIGRYSMVPTAPSLSPSRSARTSLVDRSNPSPRSVYVHGGNQSSAAADKSGSNSYDINNKISEDTTLNNDAMQNNLQQSSANSFRDSGTQNRAANSVNSVLTRMHLGRFCFWNAASSILCEKDVDAVFALSKEQLKEFARHKIITDDSLSLPADAEFKQEAHASSFDGGFTYRRSSSGSKAEDDKIDNNTYRNVPVHSVRSNSSHTVLPQQLPQLQQDKESVFHRYAPQIDWRQQFLLQFTLFSDVCQSLLLSIFVLLKHSGAGKQIGIEDVVLLLGNFISEILGRKLLDKLLFWLHSNRRTDASFKLVNQTHLDMALQRLYSFWPSLQINLRMQQSEDDGFLQSETDIPPRSSCQVVLQWPRRLTVNKLFRDPNSYEPNINQI